MANTKPSAARLRTAAAALIAAAAVASCSDSPSRTVVPAPAPSTPTTVSDTAAADLSASVAEPAAAPVTTATGAGIAAASWDYSPLAGHLSLDAVNGARMQAPNPAVIRIPRLEVEASIIPLGLQDDGSIEVPEDPDQAGWWLGGPEPGEAGPAVILGHVDSQEEGPAVFFYLQYLDPGDEIHIDRVDGSTITYVVESTERHNKDEFPTDAVYGPTEQPTLRLVTCGGDFDFGVRTYEDNVIVFASLA